MALDLASGSTREVFPPGRFGFEGYEIVKPRVSAAGRHVVFTSDRGGRWNAWGVDLERGEAFHVGKGCEPTFLPNGAVAWVKGQGALERSGIYLRDGGRERPLQDVGAPRGHEYFPTITPDGRFLLYAASRPGEHSHESANYELFVKDLATGKIARLTFDGFTNRWPKWLPPRPAEARTRPGEPGRDFSRRDTGRSRRLPRGPSP
jgi:Tol biopolymer transport system component